MEPHDPRTEIFVDLQLADVVRANLWFTYSQRSMKFSVAMGLVGVLLSTILLGMGIAPWWFVFIPPIVVLLLVITPLVIWLDARRNFAGVKEFQKHIQYVFSREGYDASSGKSSSHVSWESIHKAIESKHSLNLFLSLRLFIIIPKRCIRTSSDLAELRSILRTALGEKAQMKSVTT
jgi:hypothetical protein